MEFQINWLYTQYISCVVEVTYLKPLVQDDLLPLKPDIFRPFHESGEILLRREISSCFI